MADEIVIRVLRPEELERVKAINREVFQPVCIDGLIEEQYGQLSEKGWDHWKNRQMDSDLAQDPEGFFVAEVGGEIAGYVTAIANPEAKVGWIHNLAVARAYQGRGISRRLLEHALDYFRRRRLRGARIDSLTTNALGLAFYPRLGFRELVRQVHYFMPLDQT